MDINTAALLKMDLDAWKDAGLGDSAFKELSDLPSMPIAEAKQQPSLAVVPPKPKGTASTRVDKLAAAWPQGADFDQPTGTPLLKEVRFVKSEERSVVHKSALVKQFAQAGDRMQGIYDGLILGDMANPNALFELADTLIGLVIADPWATLALTLTHGNSLSEYQYRHAVNTAILSVATATASGFSRQQVKDIAVGGLLADVGMLLVPEEILNKVGKLAPEELAEIHRHTQMGAELLERLSAISPVTLTILLQHHERLSGAGYPRHLKGQAISHAARVVAIADTLAAMVHKRSHRDAMLTQEALDRVVKMGQMQFLDSAYIRYLAGWTSAYPVGTGVQLQSGRIGRVIASNLDDFHRPIVAVLKDASGQALPIKQITLIDLHAQADEKIVKCLPDAEAGFRGLEGF